MKKISKPNRKNIPSITFTWDSGNTFPNVKQNNISNVNINDIFAMCVEKILARDPNNFKLLVTEIDYIYRILYESDSRNIN